MEQLRFECLKQEIASRSLSNLLSPTHLFCSVVTAVCVCGMFFLHHEAQKVDFLFECPHDWKKRSFLT